jgi:fatty-acyl-CoA synthase
VVLRPGATATPRELLLSLRGRLADYKIPGAYHIVDELPRNPSGKILRRAVRERLQQPAAGALAGAANRPVETE